MNPIAIKSAKQLAIFIENRPGSLARICDEIAKAEINIEALATEGGAFSRGSEEMLVRMVLSDSSKVLALLSDMGVVAVETDVLMIEGGNQPGLLAKIADRLAKADVNIESVYVSASSDAAQCVIILRPSNLEQAMRVLRDV